MWLIPDREHVENVLNDKTREWRHHGLGMLQSEIDETKRVHVWHSDLRTIPFEGFRDVHDHRFTLESTVLYGTITDIRYEVIFANDSDARKPQERYDTTDAWEIKHAKVQKTRDTLERVTTNEQAVAAGDVTPLGRVFVREARRTTWEKDWAYGVERRAWHTTRVDGLAITLVRRFDFGGENARILGRGHSAIIQHENDDPARATHEALVQRVLDEARAALCK